MAALHTESKRVAGNLHLRDTNLSPANSLWETCPLQAIASDPTLAFTYRNDFFTYTTGEAGLAGTISNSGTVAVVTPATAASPTGTLQMEASDGSVVIEDETYLGSEARPFVLRTNKDLWFEARVLFTESATTDAKIAVGLSSIYTANFITDGATGLAASYDGLIFYKDVGDAVWQGESSQAGNQTTLASMTARTTGTWANLGIHVTSTSTVDYYVNGVQVGSLAANLPTVGMGLLFGVKNGGAGHEKLYVDYVNVVQLR